MPSLMDRLEVLRQESLQNPGLDVLVELRKLCRPPGVYFGLNEEEHRSDPSIGGSSIVKLRRDLRGWQLHSWMTSSDQRLEDEETQATILGTALHLIVLKGIGPFAQRYVRRPPDLPEASQGDKMALTKAVKTALGPGQIMLRHDEYDLCIGAAFRITQHRDLAKSLDGGENEVSVFWVDQGTGVPCKARFDRLKPSGVGDIKTIANQYGARLETECKWAIKRRRYDLQAAHYLTARSIMPKLIKDGHVNTTGTATADEMRAQEKLVLDILKTKNYAFQFIFLQKSNAAVWSQNLSVENPIIVNAMQDRAHALEQLAETLMEHGANPWPETWVLGELAPEDMPGGDYGWD